MARPLVVDNSRLKEQARQRRQEQARLQNPPEKQPSKALFGPPIPVSRPNDPTFKQLFDCFGTDVYKPFFSSPSNSESPVVENHNRKHDDSRDNTASENSLARTSRSHHGAAPPSLASTNELVRQGVFDQFAKSNSRTAGGDQVQTSAENQISVGSVRHGQTDPVSNSKHPVPDDKMKQKSVAIEKSRKDGHSSSHNIRPDEAASSQSNSSIDSRTNKMKQVPLSKASVIPTQNCSPTPSLIINSGSHDNRTEAKTAAANQRNGPGKDCEKTSGSFHDGGTRRLNGSIRDSDARNCSKRHDDAQKKLQLRIPTSESDEKSDDHLRKLLAEVNLPPPLTAILTPKKNESSTFPFPPPMPNNLVHHEMNAKGHLPAEVVVTEVEDRSRIVHKPLLNPQNAHHVKASDSKTFPDNVLQADLNLSSDSSDGEDEQMKPGGAEQSVLSKTTEVGSPTGMDRKSVVPVDKIRIRHPSESSVSSSEGSCSSGSDTDSSLSEKEDEVISKNDGLIKNDEDVDNTKLNVKRPSWEIKNFIPPKSNEQVPFIPGLLSSPSSSSPPPNVHRLTSQEDFSGEHSLKRSYDSILSPNALPLPLFDSDMNHLDSDISMDIVNLFSPSIPMKEQLALIDRPLGLPRIDVTPPVAESKVASRTTSGPSCSSFQAALPGLDRSSGRPSIVISIHRSRLLKYSKPDGAGTEKISASSNGFGKGSSQTDCKVLANTVVPATVEQDTLATVDASRLPSPDGIKSTQQRSSAKNSSATDLTKVQDTAVTKQTSPVAEPKSVEIKEQRPKKSPCKISSNMKDEGFHSNAVKRKLEGETGHSDCKKICDRNGKEYQRSPLLNGHPECMTGSQMPEVSDPVKSPARTGVEISIGSTSEFNAGAPKRNEKSKLQNGCAKNGQKASSKTSGKGLNRSSEYEHSFGSLANGIKTEAVITNGTMDSPSSDNACGKSETEHSGVGGGRKRCADPEEDGKPLDRRKTVPNKRGKYEPERLESADVYLLRARKLKHDGDALQDKFSKVLYYLESVLSFVLHCSALESEHAEPARIQKMYQDTLALCQHVIRVTEGVTNPEKYQVQVISLKVQAIICLKLYSARKAEASKLKTVLDEHNKNPMLKPLQIPSPYQTGHHHSISTTAGGSWNHANGTPSPRSPRPSPSPAGSIGSVGSAGSSNGDTSMGKPSAVNGHNMTSIVVPQRIHSVMMNYLNHMNYLHHCHDYWDQAVAILFSYPRVDEFFHSLDSKYGPIDLHSSTSLVVRYATDVVTRIRSDVNR